MPIRPSWHLAVSTVFFLAALGASAADSLPDHWKLVRDGLVSSRPCRFRVLDPAKDLSDPQLKSFYDRCGMYLVGLVPAAGPSVGGGSAIEVKNEACARIDEELIDRCAAQCRDESPEPVDACFVEKSPGKLRFDSSRLRKDPGLMESKVSDRPSKESSGKGSGNGAAVRAPSINSNSGAGTAK